jgi:hypothetical protein
MERALFDAVQQKLTDQWTAKTRVRNASNHLLTGLLLDEAGHRMAPTHATKAGIRYRYCVSLPCLHGESRTTKVGSVTRVSSTSAVVCALCRAAAWPTEYRPHQQSGIQSVRLGSPMFARHWDTGRAYCLRASG